MKEERPEAPPPGDDAKLAAAFAEIDARVDSRFQQYADQAVMQHIASLSKDFMKSKVRSDAQRQG